MTSPRSLRDALRFAAAAALIALLATGAAAQKKAVTLMDAFMNRELAGSRGLGNVQWLKDGLHYTITKKDSGSTTVSIYRVDAKTGTEERFVDLSGLTMPGKTSPFRFQAYSWSDDESRILFTLSQNRIWRRSSTGTYAVYDTKSKELLPLPDHESGLRNVKLSPDGSRIGYVFEDNIWVYDFTTKQETQLTSDAQEGVYNGRFGWVYEEEFSIVDGWQWSPDGTRIAFWHEDERSVPEYTLTDWMPLHLSLEKIRYPKPGDPNPVERIGVITLASRSTVWMDIGGDSDQYIPRIRWTADPKVLCIWRLNRMQNHLELLLADAATGASRVLLDEKSPGGWIDIENTAYLQFLRTRKQFLWASERDGWNHVYLYDMNGTLVNRVTKGPWEVTQVLGLAPDEKTLYYASTEVSPMERHLYSVRLDGSKKRELSEKEGYHTFAMSPTCAVWSDTWSSVAAPSRSTLFDADGDEVRSIGETKPETFMKYLWSPKELFTVKTSDGLELHCSMIKPPDFDPAKKYPVYFDVYGGPNTQSVRNAWPSAMEEYVANQGFIVVQCDNRGGSARGTDFKFRVYKQLGKWEANDYIECAKYLGTLPYVDKDNIGIWGWSYGGYISALTLLLGADVFKAAVAIAPVTDWKFYDSIYTERYMQRPSDNPDGYKVGSCVENADKLKGRLLIIHGGMDDNVHLQNTMHFINSLEEAGKQFDMRIYPNGNHGVANAKSIFPMYEYFMDFLKRNLKGS